MGRPFRHRREKQLPCNSEHAHWKGKRTRRDASDTVGNTAELERAAGKAGCCPVLVANPCLPQRIAVSLEAGGDRVACTPHSRGGWLARVYR